MRIVAIGDSITVGAGAPGGYRAPLHRLLVAGGYKPEWLGASVTTLSDLPGVALRHEGHGGTTIEQNLPILPRAFEGEPELALVLLGTNDLGLRLDLEHAPARLVAFVDRARALAPSSCKILVGTLPPLAGRMNEVRAFNTATSAPLWARRHGNVRIVPLFGALSLAETVDGTHPNAVGYRALAERWYRAIWTNTPRASLLAFGAAGMGAYALQRLARGHA